MNDWGALRQLIYEHSGLKLDQTRTNDIIQTLDCMLAQSNLVHVTDLIKLLETLSTAHPLWQVLIKQLTIGETYFFRNMAQYIALQNHILPQLIHQRRLINSKYLNIWSAGCSTGEEPYSIAILLQELLPDIHDWTINLLATDINTTSLNTAVTGKYGGNSFRSETRPDIRDRYFITSDDRTFEIKPDIRELVQFKTLNLISDEYPSFNTQTVHQDIIICRNVTIYFDEQNTRRTINRFYQSLIEGGWLIVGHAEPTMTTYQSFTTHNFENTVIYQKLAPIIATNTINEIINPAVETPIHPNQYPQSVLKTAFSSGAPSDTQLTIEDVYNAINREDWGTALSGLSLLERTDPMNPQVHYLRGVVLLNDGEFSKAHQALRRSLYCDPSFALAHYVMGDLHFQQNNLMEAKRCWILAERAVAGFDESDNLTNGYDLTVGMFYDLITLRLNDLIGKTTQ